MKAFYEQDANLDFLKNKTIAVIGYGQPGPCACPESA